MKHSTRKPTKAEAERMARLSAMPCVVCRLRLRPLIQPSPTEVHHLLSGNKRRGHLFTIPLCGWHHRGIGSQPVTGGDMTCDLHGPSLALRSKKFHETYGSDNELLALTNELLERNHVAV